VCRHLLGQHVVFWVAGRRWELTGVADTSVVDLNADLVGPGWENLDVLNGQVLACLPGNCCLCCSQHRRRAALIHRRSSPHEARLDSVACVGTTMRESSGGQCTHLAGNGLLSKSQQATPSSYTAHHFAKRHVPCQRYQRALRRMRMSMGIFFSGAQKGPAQAQNQKKQHECVSDELSPRALQRARVPFIPARVGLRSDPTAVSVMPLHAPHSRPTFGRRPPLRLKLAPASDAALNAPRAVPGPAIGDARRAD
jgi:hypothetical protein